MQGIRRLEDYKSPAKDYKSPNSSFPQAEVFHNSGNYRLKDYKSPSSIIKVHRNSAVSSEKL